MDGEDASECSRSLSEKDVGLFENDNERFKTRVKSRCSAQWNSIDVKKQLMEELKLTAQQYEPGTEVAV